MEILSAIFAFLAASMLLVALLIPVVIAWFVFLWRILTRAGYSGWWSLTSLFPPLFVILAWVMAFSQRWPNEQVVYYRPNVGDGASSAPPSAPPPSAPRLR